MKKQFYATLALLMAISSGAFAQRYCDVKVLPLIGPADGSNYSCNSTVVSGYYFVNMGPDTIKADDKFWLTDPNIDNDSLGNANGTPADPLDPSTWWIYSAYPTGTVLNGQIGEGEDAVPAPHIDIPPGDTIIYYKWDDTITRLHTLIIPDTYAISVDGDTMDYYYFVPDNYSIPPNGDYIWLARFLYFDTDAEDTVSNNNFEYSRITINCTTGINNSGYNKVPLTVYPNPTSTNAVYFNYTLLKPNEVKARVMDLTGRCLKTIDLGKAAAGNQKFEINIGDLPSGTYLLEFVTEDSKGVAKFTKN